MKDLINNTNQKVHKVIDILADISDDDFLLLNDYMRMNLNGGDTFSITRIEGLIISWCRIKSKRNFRLS